MVLSLLCDEHIPFPIVKGLRRRGIDVIVVQEIDLSSTTDELIIERAKMEKRIIYTQDADFLRLHDRGYKHRGVFYHDQLKYSIGEAIQMVALACEVFSEKEMKNRIEFL